MQLSFPPVPHNNGRSSLRRPRSDDSLLRAPTASSPLAFNSNLSLLPKSNLVKRLSAADLRRPIPSRTWQEPTLVELMAAEEARERREEERRGSFDLTDDYVNQHHHHDRYHAGEGEGDRDEGVEIEGLHGMWTEPESAVLHPPLYGRPPPPPSPDIFATLLQPLLVSLSRPSSRPASPSRSPPPGSPIVNRFLPAINQDYLTASSSIPADRSSSSLPAHFPPRTSNDPGPTVESQGFVLYVGSLVAWFGYLVWSLCKDEWLEAMGIAWYPSREWALLVPAWTIMLAFFVYFSYIALNIFITPALDSLHTLTDTQAFILNPVYDPRKEPHPLLANSLLLPSDAVPSLHDLPIGLVNRVVFGDFRKRRRRRT